MNIHTHSLSTALYNRNAQQYKGRGNSLQYESTRYQYIYNLYFYNAQVKSWETPNLHLGNFSQLRQTWLPSSSAPPHGHRTTHQPFVHLIARFCCFPNSGVPPSRHTRAPLPDAHHRSQSQHFTKSPWTLA